MFEQEFWERLLERDQEAWWEVVFGTRRNHLKRIISRVSANENYALSDAEVDDVFSEVILAIDNACAKRVQITNISSYMYSVIRNQCLSRKRAYLRQKNKIVKLYEASCEEIAKARISCSDKRLIKEIKNILYSPVPIPGIKELDIKLIREHYFEHVKDAELAEKYGLPENTLKSRRRRACQKLGNYLTEKYGLETIGA